MIETGLFEEVQELLRHYPKNCQAFQALGYKEIIVGMESRASKEEMVEWIKIKTRQFSKRQMTWFRHFEATSWIKIDS